MDKRYQVFVSSTFVDLKNERQAIMQTLMEMDCIPAGMELFPAADEEQMDFIKKIIDDCDYYLLLIGGRYGSTTPEGVSYTEKEYDYAISKGLKIIALLHEDPNSIPLGKSESDPVSRGRLFSFREKASTGRLVKKWSRTEDLPGLVSLSLSKTIKTYPAIGWVRGNSIANEATLTKLQKLQEENDSLRQQLIENKTINSTIVEGLADLDEIIELRGEWYTYGLEKSIWRKKLSWNDIFSLISPYIDQSLEQTEIKRKLENSIKSNMNIEPRSFHLDDQLFQTIKVQLRALGLVEVVSGSDPKEQAWTLTPAGLKLMFELRVQR